MAIACLGWGSLIWSPRTLPVRGIWQTDGPALPVEFSRQANDGRITLAITPGAKPIPVLWAELEVDRIDAAVYELGRREGIPSDDTEAHVGLWHPKGTPRHYQADVIGTWGKAKGFEAVVWTALPTGFKHARGTIPTIEEVLAYLCDLTGETRTRAQEYIRRAPEQTRTAYREVIEREL